MKLRWAWTLAVLSSLALAWTAAQAQGPGGPGPAGMYPPPGMMQGPPPGMYPPQGMMQGPPPSMYPPQGNAGATRDVPASGDDAGASARHVSAPGDDARRLSQPGMPPDGMSGPPMDMAIPAGCPQCGGAGCDACGGGHGRHGLGNGLLGDVLGFIAPYPDGGCAAPRWYDFSLEYLQLRRENPGRNTAFASQGLGGPDTGARSCCRRTTSISISNPASALPRWPTGPRQRPRIHVLRPVLLRRPGGSARLQ